MDKDTILTISSRDEFRLWLKENGKKAKECYIVLKRGKPTDSNCFYYIDAVEEAICFGWIDSTCLFEDGVSYQRFSPRRKNSFWTELNKERARRLIKLGLMEKEGKKTLPNLGVRGYRIDEDVKVALVKARCYKKFKSFPLLYQRVRASNVAFYKRISEQAYQTALSHLIKETKLGHLYGEWNDFGRLLDY